MTRKLPFTLALLSLMFVGAAGKTSWGVQRVLTHAVVNEQAAIARYTAFAEKADAEGYGGAGDLFRAEARAETIHLARLTAMMNQRGLTLPPEGSRPVVVGSTAANLQTAMAAELAERDNIYLDAYRTASSGADEEVAKIFDETRDVETEHANLCQAAARDLESMRQPHTYAVCTICGYTTDVRFPVCPLCRHPMH